LSDQAKQLQERHKEQLLESIKLSDKRVENLINEHKEELKEAIDEAYSYGADSIRLPMSITPKELYKKYNL